MLNALWLLHDNGIIHGDIKPQNVIANDAKHHVVLVDFGLSLAKPTATTKSKGHTELFSPPEQMEGKTLVPGSDFFSLGMTMLYMLGGSYDAAARKDVPADLPDPMCAFIKKLIVRDVLNRPRNAGRLFEEFQLVRKASFGRTQSGMKKFAKQ
jgi:serine/threonine-protein kinase